MSELDKPMRGHVSALLPAAVYPHKRFIAEHQSIGIALTRASFSLHFRISSSGFPSRAVTSGSGGLHRICRLQILLLVFVAALSGMRPLAAQNNEASVTAAGNFNPTTYIWYSSKSTYEPETILATSSMKSSLGGGIDYHHWFSHHLAFGVRYEQNPSDGKLLGSGNRTWYIWPQMRYEFLGMFTEQIKVNRFTPEHPRLNRFAPFIQEGAGALVTHEYGDGDAAGAGWSHSLAIAGGFGSDYWINRKLAVRVGTVILDDETGCYDDPTCRPTFGLSHDLDVGLTWAWGRTGE